jgi:hypothetical protein
VRHNAGLATLVRVPYPYVGWETVHEFPYGVVPSELDVSADGRLLSASITDVGGDQFLRVWTLATLLAGNTAPLSEFRFGQSAPESFVFTKDGRYLYGSSYYTGVSNIFRYEVATGDVKAVSNAETGLLPADPDGRRSPGRVQLHGRGIHAGDHRAAAARGPERDHLPRHRSGRAASGRHDLAGAAGQRRRLRRAGEGDRGLPPARRGAAAQRLPVLEGYKNTAAAGYHLNLGDPLGFAHLGITAAYTPDQNLPDNERATSTSMDTTSAGAPAWPGTARTSTTSSARRGAVARATRPRSATTSS